MNEQKKKRIGKFLSLVLRHDPQKIGITLDGNGWTDVNALIRQCAVKKVYFSFEELNEIVLTNDKKRYAFNEDKSMIRANQGHSVSIDLDITPIEPPEYLYHGTAERFYESIKKEGIKKMNRQHVHLSKEKITALQVGSRHGRPVILTISAREMYREGIGFYCSDNGVWLTEYVDPKYISK
jgi:RNA:NAD 2''-phosphotransferase